MVLLAVTADTWIVTGLGFGIVLVLLFFLVYVMKAFGWIMTSAEKGFSCTCKCKKAEPQANANAKAADAPQEPTAEEKAVIAMAISEAGSDDIAAVAYALYLAQDKKHDIPTAMISLHKHETAWNEKSIGMNNQGF